MVHRLLHDLVTLARLGVTSPAYGGGKLFLRKQLALFEQTAGQGTALGGVRELVGEREHVMVRRVIGQFYTASFTRAAISFQPSIFCGFTWPLRNKPKSGSRTTRRNVGGQAAVGR